MKLPEPQDCEHAKELAEALREIRDEKYSNPWDAVQIATVTLAKLEKENR